MSAFNLKCLICGHTDNNLVKIQEHAMDEHGYTEDDLRTQTKRETENGYVFIMPDGTEWLQAERVGGNRLGGL